jgi:hypothetical protein
MKNLLVAWSSLNVRWRTRSTCARPSRGSSPSDRGHGTSGAGGPVTRTVARAGAVEREPVPDVRADVRQVKELRSVRLHPQHGVDLAVDRARRRCVRVDVVVDDRAVTHLQVLPRHQVIGHAAQRARQACDQPADQDHPREP